MSYIVEGNSEMKYGLYYCQNKYRTFRVIYSDDKNYLKKIANILVYEKYQMVYIDTIYSDEQKIVNDSNARSDHFEIFNNKMGVPL